MDKVSAPPRAVAHNVMIQKIAKDHGWDPQEAERYTLGFAHTVTGVANAPDFAELLTDLQQKGLLNDAPRYAGMVMNNADIRDRLSGLGIDSNEHETKARFSALAGGGDGGETTEGPGGSDNPGVPGPTAQPSQKAARLADSKRGKR